MTLHFTIAEALVYLAAWIAVGFAGGEAIAVAGRYHNTRGDRIIWSLAGAVTVVVAIFAMLDARGRK